MSGPVAKVVVHRCATCKNHYDNKQEAERCCICKCGELVPKSSRAWGREEQCEDCRLRDLIRDQKNYLRRQRETLAESEANLVRLQNERAALKAGKRG